MIVAETTLKKLDLPAAAKNVTAGHLDRFPSLIMDACLSGPDSALLSALTARFVAGSPVPCETLTMPRRGFSPRPVTILDPGARTLYTALVSKLSETLSARRSAEDFDRHDGFGLPDSNDPFGPEYLVEFDIAACYEYVEHDRLREELLLRTMDVQNVEPCISLLGEIYQKSRGLPQLNSSSDVLADTYLEVLERALLRSNAEVSRFADDFKVPTSSWEAATKVIEDAAEQARMLGLVLASDKTNVWKATTLAARRVDANEFLQEYFAKAETALTTIEFLFGGYGIEDVIEVPPGDEETVKEALRRIFEDWYTQQAADLPHHSQYLPASLRILAGAEERLPNNWLIELVFRQPLRLENVCSYLMARQEPTENWQTLSELAEMKRQSPWAKLWLLYVAAAQPRDEAKAVTDFDAWAGLQIVDRHEVVRSQAAWYLTISPRSIGPNQLGVLYREASNFDSPGNRR